MTPDLQKIAEALGNSRQNGDGSYTCSCPNQDHDDHNPSCSISYVNGKLLAYCHGGCSQEVVISALKDLGLWIESSSSTSSHIPKELRKKRWQQMSPIPDGVGDLPSHPSLGPPSSVYTYKDIDGNPVGYVNRYDRPDGSKDIRPLIYAKLEHVEDWRWQGFDKPRPLYGLEQLKDKPAVDFMNPDHVTPKVLVVEGEKTADAARVLFPNIPVMTWSGGAKGVKHTDWKPLRFYDVVIWPDNDDAGKQAALDIADIFGESCSVSIVDPPPELERGWDLADAAVMS